VAVVAYGGNHMGERPRKNPRERESGNPSGEGRREDFLVCGHLLAHLKPRIYEKFRTAKEKWHEDPVHHGTEEIPPPPPPPQEVMPGPRKKRIGPDGRSDSHRALAFSRVSQANPQTNAGSAEDEPR
jgi:hypothetical protein